MRKYFFRIVVILLGISILLPLVVNADEDNPFLNPNAPMLLNSMPKEDADYKNLTVMLVFSHNVADVSIRKNNTAAISVQTKDGENVSAKITYSDSFSERCNIYVVMENLHPDTMYYIYIGRKIQAYNGATADSAQKVTFRTKVEETTNQETQKHEQSSADADNDTGGENGGKDQAKDTNDEETSTEETLHEEHEVIIGDNDSTVIDPINETETIEEETTTEEETEETTTEEETLESETKAEVVNQKGEETTRKTTPFTNPITGAFYGLLFVGAVGNLGYRRKKS